MQNVLPALAAFVLLCGSAAGEPSKPPKRYDHRHPALIVVEQTFRKIDPLCRAMFPRNRFPAATETHRITGCGEIGDGRQPCRILVPKRGEGVISEAHRRAIIRHETAHCNGWPSHHPRS